MATAGGDMSQDGTVRTSRATNAGGRDHAVASGWLPADIVGDWPSLDARQLIVDRRRSLYEAMQELEAAAARASGQPDWRDEVESALTALMTALDHHVAEIEAPNGLFDEVVDRAPHLQPRVTSLREDHERLRKACRNALDTARIRPGPTAGAMRRKILTVLGRLSAHRQDGAELLYDAHNVDLPAGD